jgi:hypothetical protein
MYTDTEAVEAIRQLIKDTNNGKISDMQFFMLVDMIVNPHTINRHDLEWAIAMLEQLRKMANYGTQN